MLTNSQFNSLQYKMHLTKLEKALSDAPEYAAALFDLMKEMVPESSITPPPNSQKILL